MSKGSRRLPCNGDYQVPRCRLWVGRSRRDWACRWIQRIRWITMSRQQAAYHPELHDHIQYMHYTELDDAETFDVIFTFQCTEHMRSDELHRFCQKMESLLTPNCILLVEFMTTVTEFNLSVPNEDFGRPNRPFRMRFRRNL